MKTTLIRAERLLFGPYRYRLEVCRSWWIFRRRSVYSAKLAPLAWHGQDGIPAGQGLSMDLTVLLARALALKMCPPQALPGDLVPGVDMVEITGYPGPMITYSGLQKMARGVSRG